MWLSHFWTEPTPAETLHIVTQEKPLELSAGCKEQPLITLISH